MAARVEAVVGVVVAAAAAALAVAEAVLAEAALAGVAAEVALVGAALAGVVTVICRGYQASPVFRSFLIFPDFRGLPRASIAWTYVRCATLQFKHR